MAAPVPPPAAPAKAGGLVAWIYKRLPVEQFIRDQATGYYAPKNFNIWYFFGSLALVVLVLQLATGIFLTMFYKPGEATSFDSVEFIMREVQWGWLIRYMHSTGASVFFIVVYLHMFRSMMYGSYKAPRELLWLIGMLVYLALMAEAFFGYVLPWGNMSFWGAQVIVNLFGTIPVIGPGLVLWIRGDYGIADATLGRFFALHVAAVPLAILLLVMLHLVALRHSGSNNPDGIEIKERVGADGHPLDGIPFHPYYTVKDIVGIGVMLVMLAIVVFFVPSFGGLFLEAPNFGGAPDVPGGGALCVPAVARSLAGQIDALSRPALKGCACDVCRLLRGARLPWPAAGRRVVRHPRAHLRRRLFRVLHPDAVVLAHRQGEARARTRGFP
jgi:ubiquinol-cytochrome c reductase cytochrome b subunit